MIFFIKRRFFQVLIKKILLLIYHFNIFFAQYIVISFKLYSGPLFTQNENSPAKSFRRWERFSCQVCWREGGQEQTGYLFLWWLFYVQKDCKRRDSCWYPSLLLFWWAIPYAIGEMNSELWFFLVFLILLTVIPTVL